MKLGVIKLRRNYVTKDRSMGRDTTASKRMAAKRSREREAGLRRLNVAVKPEVFDKLTELVKQYNCTSQASLIELLVMDNSNVPDSRKVKEERNEVTHNEVMEKNKVSINQQHEFLRKTSPKKPPKGEAKVVTSQNELLSAQMSLFEN